LKYHNLKIFMNLVSPIISFKKRIRSIYEADSAFKNRDIPPIIVYTMGKVGSSTVYNSLLAAPLVNPVLQVHFISKDLSKNRQYHKRARIYPPPYGIYLGEAIQKKIEKDKGFPIKIISLVRDPIALIISDLFQNPHFHKEILYRKSGTIDAHKATKYLDLKLNDQRTFTYINEWFDRELRSVFGIDVFSVPFQKESGYSQYSKDNIEVIVIRLEDLSRVGHEVISDFIGITPPLTLVDSNIRANTKTKNEYSDVVKSVSLDINVCRKIYSSEFVKHFYDDKMIDHFIYRWCKNI
jgi:hypothetical protein